MAAHCQEKDDHDRPTKILAQPRHMGSRRPRHVSGSAFNDLQEHSRSTQYLDLRESGPESGWTTELEQLWLIGWLPHLEMVGTQPQAAHDGIEMETHQAAD
jgi:hypothetical protein